MVFSSLIFVYAFLPLSLIFYVLAKNIKVKNAVLLIFSLLFYAWGEPTYVLILVFMTFSDWVSALLIEKSKSKSAARFHMTVAVIINIGLIGFFKYSGFALTNIQSIFGVPEVIPKIALPIGISFYTFQLLSYVIDVYRKEVPAQKNFFLLLLYSSLFYQCIAGPIVRYKDVNDEIEERSVDSALIGAGITRFTVGLAKKALIANLCGSLADSLLVPDSLFASGSAADAITQLSGRSVLALWFGVIFYMLQIYLDFSAYSDMAIGMGYMVGFKFKENFNYPYIANSVTDFWRRWHISLSTFFRDYVYIPLGGNRKGKLKTYRNLLIVWFLTGLWHGASWNFILWGLYFFVFLTIEKAGFLNILKKIPAVFGHVYLLLIVFFGWILFKFSDFSAIPIVLKGLFGLNGNAFSDFETNMLLLKNIFFTVAAVLSVTPLVHKIKESLEKHSETSKAAAVVYKTASVISPVALLFLSTLTLVGDSYNPFLYFQF